MSKPIEDLTGVPFGRLTPREYLGGSRWLCDCSCGGTTRSSTDNLRAGHSTSCGCINRERMTTHGKSDLPEYKAWADMIQRCTNPNHKNYGGYGGRGIVVCDRWKNSFEAFLQDMGSRPTADHTLDREDNDGPYEPGNCRWVTRPVQDRNKRTNRNITFQSRTQTITDWANEIGITAQSLGKRLRKGWPLEAALTRGKS